MKTVIKAEIVAHSINEQGDELIIYKNQNNE